MILRCMSPNVTQSGHDSRRNAMDYVSLVPGEACRVQG
jgi:hypothetical protein